MLMQALQASMAGGGAQAEEDRLLMFALEESKQNNGHDPSNPNPDTMTYEQMLELEERNGKVCKGLNAA